MNENIELRDDIWWPKIDTVCHPYTMNEKDSPSIVSKFCDSTRTVIQAGGNVGYYALQYSKIFDTVYTFEPDQTNFLCLALNTANSNNIYKMQACLGDSNEPVEIEIEKYQANQKFLIDGEIGANTGAYHIKGNGAIPCITIDSLNLPNVDLIQLDVEGYEGRILLGAEQTIVKYRPLLVLELKHDHGKRYGWGKKTYKSLLGSLGYQAVGTLGHDVIYKCINL